jgi:cell division protein FtsW
MNTTSPAVSSSPSAASQGDARQVLLIASILVGFGVVMVYSSSSVYADGRFGDSGFFLGRQIARAVCGVVVMFALSRVPLEFWQRVALPLLIVGVTFLVLVLAIGHGRSASRWLTFPMPSFLPSISFQPSEFVRLVLVLYLADVLVRKERDIGHWWNGVVPRIIIIAGVQLLILLQPDLGTCLAVSIIAGAMLWVGGARTAHLLATVGLAAPIVAVSVYNNGYQMKRVMSFFVGADSQQAGYQMSQSLTALGSGGFFGVGLGSSVQKHFFLPEAHTDFVFAFVGEELGLAGCLSIIGLFVALAIYGYRIARGAATPFGFLVAVGVTFMISVYAVLNVGVVTGMMPTTGLPLPFISYGGSSLLWNLCGVGILAAVARQSTGSLPPRVGAGFVADRTLAHATPIRAGWRRLQS